MDWARSGKLWIGLLAAFWGIWGGVGENIFRSIGCPGCALGGEPNRHTLIHEGSRLLVYQAAPHPKKPYVAELFSPEGVNFLRDSPQDHKHHHGLMFAVAVDGVNFWAEDPASGTQLPVGPVKTSTRSAAGAVWQVMCQNLRWQSPQGTVMLEEERVLAASRFSPPPVTLLTWQSTLRVPEGKDVARLTGSAYFGLGMRFVASMDAEGRFFNAEGKTEVAGTNGTRAAWCAYTAKAEGKPVTVAVFDWPKNPQHPATWFTMEKFAYLSATLNLHKEPFSIQAGQPVNLRYGIAVWDGQVESEVVDKCYKTWTDLPWPEENPSDAKKLRTP